MMIYFTTHCITCKGVVRIVRDGWGYKFKKVYLNVNFQSIGVVLCIFNIKVRFAQLCCTDSGHIAFFVLPQPQFETESRTDA